MIRHIHAENECLPRRDNGSAVIEVPGCKRHERGPVGNWRMSLLLPPPAHGAVQEREVKSWSAPNRLSRGVAYGQTGVRVKGTAGWRYVAGIRSKRNAGWNDQALPSQEPPDRRSEQAGEETAARIGPGVTESGRCIGTVGDEKRARRNQGFCGMSIDVQQLYPPREQRVGIQATGILHGGTGNPMIFRGAADDEVESLTIRSARQRRP